MPPPITFHPKQLSSETPKLVKNVYRGLMVITTLWAISIQPQLNLGDHIDMIVYKSLSIGNAVFYAVCQLFGYLPPTDDAYDQQVKEDAIADKKNETASSN